MREKCCRRSTAEPSRSRRATALPDFAGKVAIVTGAAGGLGLAIAERLASEGAAVVLADVDLAGAEAARRKLAAGGGRALAQRTDLRDAKDGAALVARTLAEFGRLHILISNARLGGTRSVLVETP